MLDARRLLVLQAIAEHRSFTRAAEALVMTQPAVSRQLAALEREVGAQLVVRGPRHVSLTPAGVALAEEADAIVAAIDAAARRLKGFDDREGGAVRLGAIPSAMATFVPDALRALRLGRPRVEIQADEGWTTDLIRSTARGDLDLAIVSASGAASAGETLVREPFVALLPDTHALAGRRRLRLRDLAGERWILAPDPGGRLAVLAACASAGFTPRVVGSATWQGAAELVGAGVGVGLAPESIAARLRAGCGVRARALVDVPVRELRLVNAPRPRPTPVERELEHHLREAAAREVREP